MRTLLSFLFLSSICFGQADSPELKKIQNRLDSIEDLKQSLKNQMESIKLEWIRNEITAMGVPATDNPEEIVEHSAYFLSYNEKHEQANWVMHIILPDIIEGNVSRTNDFREDPLVKTGSAVEKDYFLKELKADSTYKYDGFGYDRGHLAPSADFRWSRQALSESYFYSNMSPQIGDFNRLKWAELENWMRDYVISNETHLYVITAPVLSDDLLPIERSVNKVSIPEYFVKVALDMKNERGIAFVLPHQKIEDQLELYTVSIDSAEKVLGYDLFSNLEDAKENKIEAAYDYKPWLPEREKGDVKPIEQKRLPKNANSTYGVEVFKNDGKKHTVCGTVVSTKKHDKGHVFINLDKKFPNQIFSVSIFASSIQNFDYEPEIYLKDKEVCFTGEIGDYNGTPSMVIDNGKKVKLLEDY
jgi:endonuclease G